MKGNKTKGERLNWTPLHEFKPTPLTSETVKGVKVKHDSKSNSTSQKGKTRLLVP